ncbi:signal peptidase I [Thermocrinis minervae]|uniref:Signal peptidase I n=1 Tax=Thermocrinis minervae TaxID=381751 RepID=A0A1M6S724_9AQUI|nr:signal peptidase I [Thermocrinis minervae]SHK40449.1 signal peptidase I [Thermocrinis minervae]
MRLFKEFVAVLIVVLLIRTFVAQAYNIPSGSMKPTLLVGDFILVNKLVYRFSEPQRGDVIVFKWPVDERLDFIKRIIAVPGDTVEVRGAQVIVNGKPLPLRYVGEMYEEGSKRLVYEETLPNGRKHLIYLYANPMIPRKDFGPAVVPPDNYFVMGDNRDNSEDSRYWGFLPRENIVGKAFVIYYSGETPPLNTTEVSLLTGLRQLFIALLHPRFDRIGMSLIDK